MGLHAATRELLSLADGPGRNLTLKRIYLQLAVQGGTAEDADAALAAFLSAPEDRDHFLKIVAEHGQAQHAQALLDAATVNGRLKDGFPDEVLGCLGYMGFEDATALLWSHASDLPFGSMGACLGLLHLSCAGLEERIRQAILGCVGLGIFCEFLPALAIKSSDPAAMLETIFAMGRTASTDCNGGIVLGVALYGNAGRAKFEHILWDPQWDAWDGATGTVCWTYAGMVHLGIKLSALYQREKHRLISGTHEDRQHGFKLFAGLLGCAVDGVETGLRFVRPRESFLELHQAFYIWSDPNTDDSITGLASDRNSRDEHLSHSFWELERLLALRLEREIEIALQQNKTLP